MAKHLGDLLQEGLVSSAGVCNLPSAFRGSFLRLKRKGTVYALQKILAFLQNESFSRANGDFRYFIESIVRFMAATSHPLELDGFVDNGSY